jgi:hypothetical protein
MSVPAKAQRRDWQPAACVLCALRISPADATVARTGAGWIRRGLTRRGRCSTPIEMTDRMRVGNISLPNCLGLNSTNSTDPGLDEMTAK